MSESTKKALLIVVVIVAVIAAGFSAFRFATSDQPVASGVDNSLPPGSKTGKQLEVEAMERARAGGGGGEREGGGDASGGPAPTGG